MKMFFGLLIFAYAVVLAEQHEMYMPQLAADPCDTRYYETPCQCLLNENKGECGDNEVCSSADNATANEACRAKGFSSGFCYIMHTCKVQECTTTKRQVLESKDMNQTCSCEGDYDDAQNMEAMRNYARAIYELQVKSRRTSCPRG